MVAPRFAAIMTTLVLVLAPTACGKSDDGGSASSHAKSGEAGLDEAGVYFLKTVQGDIAEVRDRLAKGEDPKFLCAGAGAYASKLEGKPNAEAQAAVAELEKICTRDVPLAALEKSVAKAEAARKAAPDANPLSECHDASRNMAVQELARSSPTDEQFRALTARWDAVCPPK
jgi:hypothetical protein